MKYTYKGKNYPKDIQLKHPEIETILSKDPLDITRRELDAFFDIDDDEIHEDEEKLILLELGKQWGKSYEELKNDKTVNPFVIRNTLITLITTYDLSSFDVVLEILRQSEDIVNFNLPDYKGFTYILPMLTYIFEYKPKLLKDFLLEEGITERGKQIVLEELARIGCEEDKGEDIRKRLVSMFKDILDAYIADYPEGKICDKRVVSHAVKAIVKAALTELADHLQTVYDKDMVDLDMCGDLQTNLGIMKEVGTFDLNYVETLQYPLMFLPIDFFWVDSDNQDLG